MLDRSAIVEAPRWAWGFYWRRLPLVLGICLVPAVERFTGRLWERPTALGVGAEALTLAARLLLVLVVVRLGLLADPQVGRISWDEGAARARTAMTAQWPAVAVQAAGICVLFLLCDLVPEVVVPLLVDVGPLYFALLLMVKNLTVIPLVLIWWVGLARQLVRRRHERRRGRRGHKRTCVRWRAGRAGERCDGVGRGR